MSPVTHLSSQCPLIRSADPARKTQIMAILNLTPDSFSDGGLHNPSDTAALAETINNAVTRGASIIDIGGQSTRPGATEVSPSEELARILPAIESIRRDPALDSTIISVDTFLPSVAKQAIEAGAAIINDISGGQLSDDKLLKVVADQGKTIVLMHMRGDPSTMNSKASYPTGVVKEVGEELKDRVDAALAAGIPRWRIILDPGIGFAKNGQQNLILLRDLAKLRSTPGLEGYSWLLGTSRKAFIGRITGATQPRERVMGTAATVTASIAGGADIVRVHDVEEMRQVAAMSDAIYRHPA
jgi:2-amino-4-hydroxy-6-hydroxymethyldihydropteridine diphosphokinase / dihydropteroate synthase